MASNKATICIGSNVGQAKQNVTKALAWLKQLFDSYHEWGPYMTEPYGEDAGNSVYFNAVACGLTEFSADELNRLFKEYEQVNGRGKEQSSADGVAIDIDLVAYNGTILRKRHFAAPYFIEGFRNLPDFQ